MTVTSYFLLPDTNFVAPTDAELAKLLAIVVAGRPELRGKVTDPGEFKRAFTACEYFRRTATPRRDRYFSFFVNAANDLLRERLRVATVGGEAFLAAVFAHADICWRAPDPRWGVLLEVGLDAYKGACCNNAWRGLLDGTANLLAPIPPVAT